MILQRTLKKLETALHISAGLCLSIAREEEGCDRTTNPLAATASSSSIMAPSLDRQGYWGRPTSTLDWCEENYVVSFYIAEFCK